MGAYQIEPTVVTSTGLWGEFEHGLDEKGRVSLPVEFRQTLDRELVICRAPDKAAMLMTREAWHRIEEHFMHEPIIPSTSYLRRVLAGRANLVIDSRGRIAIPTHIQKWCEIGPNGRIVLLGQGSRIELWSPVIWHQYQSNFTLDRLVESVDKTNLSDLFADHS